VDVHPSTPTLAEMMTNFAELLGQLDREPEPLASVLSARDGTFRMEGVGPGPGTLVVRAPGFRVEQRPLVLTAGDEEAAPIVVRLHAGGVVAGRVLAEDGRGIDGVRVALMVSDSPEAFSFGRSFVETSDGGLFRFDTVGASGEVLVIAAAAGYPSAMRQTTVGTENLEIVLRHGATLVVHVVRGEREEPLEDASVLLAAGREADFMGGAPESLVTGRTDRTGRVTFEVAPGAIQMVMISHPEGAGGVWAGSMRGMPGMGIEGPEDATLQPGRQEKQFRLGGGRVVVGTVTADDGTPIRGAEVMSIQTLQGGRAALSDEAGRYRLVVTGPEGFLALLVRAEGYVQDKASMGLSGGGAAETAPNERGEIVRDIVMHRAAVVTGRVVDETGRPLAGARIRVTATAEDTMGVMNLFRPAEGLTGKDGRYVLDGAAPEEEGRVLARLEGFVDGASPTFKVSSGALTRAPDVVLLTGAAVDLTVTDPDGRPLAGARVEVNVDAKDAIQWDFMERWRNEDEALTDAAGRAKIEHLPVGKVTLAASHPEYATAKTVVEVGSETTGSQSVRLAVRATMVVAGRVTDEAGKPLEAFVLARPVAGSPPGGADDLNDLAVSARAGKDGRFRLERVPLGAVAVSVQAEGYRRGSARVDGPTDDLHVPLEKVSADVVARRKELTESMLHLSQQMQSASTNEERRELARQIQMLNQELQQLKEAESPDGAPPAPLRDAPEHVEGEGACG
jgi:protocatechuate 3,4-dioxygenase beta subunit